MATTRTRSGSSPDRPAARGAATSKRSTYVPPDPANRWRPRSRAGGVCGYVFDGKICRKRGAHYCEPRADRVVAFCAELLVHTTGPYARKAFVLEPWQEFEIIRPLFGEVVWSGEWGRYVRRYRIAYIVMARKNGKSALVAALVLYLLVGDDEEGAEVYGAAKTTRQAGKVFKPVRRMMQLSPVLSKRLDENKAARRIFDEATGSFYEVIPADALGELGHNPHGFVLDEVLAMPDRTLWDAMRTALGARAQALMVAITTETNVPQSFGADLIDEAEKTQEDPARAPHIFAWVRKTPIDADPFDEANWWWPNPALGTFKSLSEMRSMASEAQSEPEKENAFRQLQLNQRVAQVTRWMPLPLWDAGAGLVVPEDLVGRACFAGLDLASTTDLAAWVLRFPAADGKPPAVLWRFWTPEAQLRTLDRYTAGAASTWVAQGLLTATEGDWIDYEGDPTTGRSGSGLAIHPQIAADHGWFRILKVGYDQAQATATAQFMQRLGLDVAPVPQGFGVSAALKEIMRLVKHDAEAGPGEVLLGHGGHAVARWNVDSAEVKRDDGDRIKLVKPDRSKSGARIDGLAALANAVKIELEHVELQTSSVYEERGMVAL